jgi:hypothetical protein
MTIWEIRVRMNAETDGYHVLVMFYLYAFCVKTTCRCHKYDLQFQLIVFNEYYLTKTVMLQDECCRNVYTNNLLRSVNNMKWNF